MNNYRVTFGGSEIDYKSDFDKCRAYWPDIKRIFSIIDSYSFERSYFVKKWFFFESYVEITWIEHNPSAGEQQIREISAYLKERNISDVVFKTPNDGVFADWYYNKKAPRAEKELSFGVKRYAACSKQAELFYENMSSIERGKGLENHYVRSCHVLANQLALNYKDEGRLLFWRAILCKLFYWFRHKKAVWIYTKIFRQTY